jgi:lysophospholipase L1-like esterase
MSKVRFAAFALLAVLPASRALAQPRMPTHVACVGDSITAGYMASSSAAAYPSVLQNMFGASVQVRNFGHSGATLLSTGDQPYQNQTEYTSATTFVSGAGSGSVVDVIIMLGTNDSKSYNWMTGTGTRAQQFVTDLGGMFDHFASLSTHPVVYLALPAHAFQNTYGIDGTIIHDQILPLVRQVATAKGAPLIDVDTPTAPHMELFPDGVHPNDTGYALVAQVMHDGLLRVPQVMLTAPAAGATVAGPAVTVAASASGGTVAITSVELFHATGSGQPTSIARLTASPFMATWPDAAPGSYQLTAKATDSTGAAATSSPVMVTVSGGSDAGQGGQGGQGGVAMMAPGAAAVAVVHRAPMPVVAAPRATAAAAAPAAFPVASVTDQAALASACCWPPLLSVVY